MATKLEIIAYLKLEHRTLAVGDDENGYVELNAKEYEAKIAEWADNILTREVKELAIQEAEAQKVAILAKLGITADELRIALS